MVHAQLAMPYNIDICISGKQKLVTIYNIQILHTYILQQNVMCKLLTVVIFFLRHAQLNMILYCNLIIYCEKFQGQMPSMIQLRHVDVAGVCMTKKIITEDKHARKMQFILMGGRHGICCICMKQESKICYDIAVFPRHYSPIYIYIYIQRHNHLTSSLRCVCISHFIISLCTL